MKLFNLASELELAGVRMRDLAEALESLAFCERVLAGIEAGEVNNQPGAIDHAGAMKQHRDSVQRLLKLVQS